MTAAETPLATPRLPELRQELKLEVGAAGPGGAPTWLIVDPVQHRYVQIDEAAYHLLSHWRAGVAYGDLAGSLARDFGRRVSDEEIAQFVKFLNDNSLTVEPGQGGWQHFSALAARARHGWLMWLVHNYLYIRLPLVRPEPFLLRALPLVAPLYTRAFAAIVAAIGVTGLYLVSRQWDAFGATFQYLFSWQGAATYGLALILVKSAHELGHACGFPMFPDCLFRLSPKSRKGSRNCKKLPFSQSLP